jgi:N-hydroxyarylamine O-acetyltransferase
MSEPGFDLDAYLSRIGLAGPLAPTLGTLRRVVAAHCIAIAYENIDVLLGRPPQLDLTSLHAKLVAGRRGGYCFEQNMLLRAGLRALGFGAKGMLARVVRGLPADTPRGALHMVLRVDLAEGPFLVDVGFGNLTPTGPLAMRPEIEQITPHEMMRLLPVVKDVDASDLVLQARLGHAWENLWRLCSHAAVDADFEVANWFTATNPNSLFRTNMIAARPGPDGTRHTFLNGRVTVRRPDGSAEREDLIEDGAIADVLATTFGLTLASDDIRAALRELAGTGRRGAPHQFFC